ncbi:MAG: TonB-dependent receptor [Bacteroidaceae bacterium]|nr:TonB-dependent receptor [Bacteroidaceae bacterium]
MNKHLILILLAAITLALPANAQDAATDTIQSDTIQADTIQADTIQAAAIQADTLTADPEKPARRLTEVIVTTSNRKLTSPQIGVENVRIQEMRNLPSLFGERDIIRQLQLLPGVKAQSDGSSGFQVRGGTAGQNHILLDDGTIYNSGHMLGLFSTFNDAIIASADLYKGAPPANFGGGTSSVLNVLTKNAQPHFALDATVGILSAKIAADIPLGKKAMAFVAFRRTYFDLFLKIPKKYRGTTLNFYDLNAKISYNINDRNRLWASFFRGRDNMAFDDMMTSGWGNMTGNLRFWHAFNDSHYSTTSAFATTYSYDSETDMDDITSAYDTGLFHLGLKQSFNWQPTDSLTFLYGFQTRYTKLNSLNITQQSYNRNERRRAWENEFWLNAEWTPVKCLSLMAGLRLNIFSALGGAPFYDIDENGEITNTYNYSGGEFVKTHIVLEPRVSANIRLTPYLSLKAGYARLAQNIRPLYNNGMATVFNRYTMSSNIIQPEISNQVSLGATALLANGMYELSAEAYYKTIDNVIDYKDGKNFNSEIEVERVIRSGKGRSYGFEFLARKNQGRLSGFLTYTLAWSENQIDGINKGLWYTAANDRRHDISVALMFKATKKWEIAATWVFLTGQAYSAPSAKYDINNETIYYYAERNGYRAPAYHRLDISATLRRQHHTKRGKQWSSEWSFGIYNVYNRYNPYTIRTKNNPMRPSGTLTTLTAMFGLMPSVSYTIKY